MGALVIIALLGVVGWQILFGTARGGRLVIHEVAGQVQRVDGLGKGQDATAGMSLTANDRIVAGEGGRAVLALGPETRVTVDAKSAVRVLQVGESGVKFELEGGRVHANVRPGSGRVGISSEAREASTEDGAFTAVRGEDGTFAVSAEAGRVDITGVSGVTTLSAGERVVAPVGGNPLQGPASDALLLDVIWPTARRTREEDVEVTGTTEPGATLKLGRNGEWVTARADKDGRFRARVAIGEGENTIEVHATSLLGNLARVDASVTRDTTAPQIGIELHTP